MSKKLISRNTVKKSFNHTGLALILYILLILFLPLGLTNLYELKFFNFKDEYHVLLLLFYLITLFGTLIPFFLIQKIEGIEFKEFCKPCNYSLLDFISDVCLVISLGSILIYIYSAFLQYFSFDLARYNPINLFNSDAFLFDPLYAFLFVVTVPMVEEYAFRGVLLRNLGRYGNLFGSISISLIYALMHNNLFDMIQAFVLSYLLIKMTLKYRSIQPAIIVHIIFNGFIYLESILSLEYNYLFIFIVIVIYILTLVFIALKVFKKVKLINNNINKISFKLFYTRTSIILSFVLIIIYKILLQLS